MSCDKLARKYTTFLVDIQIKNAVFALKDGILGGHYCDFRCYMLRCGFGTSSTILRLSYGYLSVILRNWLLNCCRIVVDFC